MEKKKVLLGMSGGVDSSVSAILLQERGYEVIGLTMKLFSGDMEATVNDARRVCEKLGIKHYVADYTQEFKTHVITDFINQYKDARTPNPCVECNKYLKFGMMWQKAKELGIDYIATGHYAKVEYSDKYNRYILRKSASVSKDQSYVLYNIPNEILEHVIFPLDGFKNKEQIREIAKKHGLEIANKPDSQEICFIPDNNYINFLNKNITEKEKMTVIKQGNIVDRLGNIRGRHKGIINYTIGQRKGLGIQNPNPLYVIKLDKTNNEVVVGEKQETYSSVTIVQDINLLLIDELNDKIKVKAKIRYKAKEASATIEKIEENKIKVIFDEPQMAITPGQSIVFYIDDIVLGGGKIS